MTVLDHAQEVLELLEEKARYVRTPEGAAHFGLPIGAMITPDAAARAKLRGAKPARSLARVKKPAEKPVERRTGGSGRTHARKPVQANTGRGRTSTAERAGQLHRNIDANTTNDGRLRAWGPAEQSSAARRANVSSRNFNMAFVRPAELESIRERAIERGRNAPRPAKHDIADNKRINNEGGVGTTYANDTLRGNKWQRAANSWAVYVAFGGVNSKTGKDRGYVPCVGCGMKMSWHDDERYSQFPKFELDKIVTGGDGGQYNPQNLVPMCAGCNNQRGNKKFWESPAFRGAKPRWYNAAFQEEVRKTRPKKRDLAKGENRPAKEIPPWPMPIPPGPEPRIRPISRKSADEPEYFTADELRQRASGTRIRARLLNYDGRYPNLEVPERADETFVGELVVNQVDSAWGTYTQTLVILDDMTIRFIEPESIQVVAEAPDKEEKTSVRAAEVFKMFEDMELESKGVRRVRTPAGVARFKQPIGSIIIGGGRRLLNLELRDSDFGNFDAVEAPNGPRAGMYYVGKYDGDPMWSVTDADDEVLFDGKTAEEAWEWLEKHVNMEPPKMKVRRAPTKPKEVPVEKPAPTRVRGGSNRGQGAVSADVRQARMRSGRWTPQMEKEYQKQLDEEVRTRRQAARQANAKDKEKPKGKKWTKAFAKAEDRKLKKHYDEHYEAAREVEFVRARMMSMVGAKKENGEWSMTDREAVAKLREIAKNKDYRGSHARELLADIKKANAESKRTSDAMKEQEKVWEEHGKWPRFFMVQGGHIHRNRSCSSLRPTTRIGWLPELSGESDEEAVHQHGPVMCTKCFPDAPVEWTRGQDDDSICPGSGKFAAGVDSRRMSIYAECPVCGKTVSVVRKTLVFRKHKKGE